MSDSIPVDSSPVLEDELHDEVAHDQINEERAKPAGTRNGLVPFVLKKDLKGYPKVTQSFIMLSCRGRTVNITRIQEQLEKEGVSPAIFVKHPRLTNIFFFRRGNEDRQGDTKFCETFNCGKCRASNGECQRSHSCVWCRKEGHGFLKCPKHTQMAKERAKHVRITDERIAAIYSMLNGKHGLGLGFRVEL